MGWAGRRKAGPRAGRAVEPGGVIPGSSGCFPIGTMTPAGRRAVMRP